MENFNFDKIRAMAEILGFDNSFENIISLMERIKTPSSGEFKPYDDEINTPVLMAVKSAIPFLDSQSQRKMGILVKVIEIQQLLKMYESNAPQALNINWQRNMIAAVKPYTDESTQKMLETLIRLIDFNDFMEVFNNANQSRQFI